MCDQFEAIKQRESFLAKVYDRVLHDQRQFPKTMENIIDNHDYNALVKYCLLFENKVLSLINYRRPMLYDCVKFQFYKGFEFFFQCIKHFSELLGNIGDTSDFITEYFAYNAEKTIDRSNFVKSC